MGLEAPAGAFHVGIDASNLRAGGGVTHLIEMLSAANPGLAGCETVTVWGARELVDRLPVRHWLRPVHVRLLDGRLPARIVWQRARLHRAAASACDILFVPGGSYAGSFRPFVTMSRNMVPFDPATAARYGNSYIGLRLRVLTRVQTATFRTASGVIFLTETSRRMIQARTGELPGRTTVIPHGVSRSFAHQARSHEDIETGRPFRWLYVSIVDLYKHQWTVAEAAALLRAEGLPVNVEFVGPAYGPALRMLRTTMDRVDPGGAYLRYSGAVPFTLLPNRYARADGFVFASSCENMPNILLEAMAAGLPVACSDRGVMPEVLGDGGEYFDPENAVSIAGAMRRLMEHADRRRVVAGIAAARAAALTWERSANDTFAFLRSVVTSADSPGARANGAMREANR